MEGGLEQTSVMVAGDGVCRQEWFECGWIAVVQRETGKVSVASTARVPLGAEVVRLLVEEKKELCDVVDQFSGKTDVRSNEGFMGIVTNGALPRDECYAHGILFAFAPFVSDPVFWR